MIRSWPFILVFITYQFAFSQSFIEVSEEAGINHAFRVDLATFGGGAAVLDFNNDGFEDVYITGGSDPDVLYRNNGNGTFTDIFDEAGFDSTIPIHTQGAAAADINRDGFKDLLITTMYYLEGRELSPNLLFLNNGDGTFKDVTQHYGLDKFKSNSMGASFGDINADGYPDLYVVNYFATSPNGVSIFNGQTITNNFAPASDFLFINASGERFIDARTIYGMDHTGFGFEATFSDWDNDQDADILVANDFGYSSTPNVALINEYPERTLTDGSRDLVLNFGMNAMGIAVGDYNFDGWMDYFVSNISESLFAVNNEGTSFENSGTVTGLGIPLISNEEYTGVPVSWGANFFDYDHDTDLDLFVNNGALNPTIRPNPNFFFELRNGLYWEIGSRTGVADARVGRGSVVFDYDNDGDMDLLVVNQHPRDPTTTLEPARCLLYRNDAADGNWLKVKLEGVRAEKDGIGSRIEVVSDGKLLIREVDGGSSHMSQNSTIVHFGLGDAETVQSVTVKWLGGNKQELTNVVTNQQIDIKETVTSNSSLTQNVLSIYPSYFTDQMFIEYELETQEPFDISVFDVQGRLVKNLVQQDNPSNTGIWRWDIQENLIHGVYFVQLRTKNSITTQKAVKL